MLRIGARQLADQLDLRPREMIERLAKELEPAVDAKHHAARAAKLTHRASSAACGTE